VVCSACGAENRDEARFCDACGAPLAATAVQEHRKQVTVLFCDVSGSTALGEQLDPEAYARRWRATSTLRARRSSATGARSRSSSATR
jgi:class 3 adenylate cyclase